MLRVKNLQVERNGFRVIHDLSLEVRPGTVWALVGANGSGKSTALLAIAGRLPTCGGQILWENDESSAPGPMPHVGLLLQSGRIFPTLTVLENLEVSGTGLDARSIHSRIVALSRALPDLARLATVPAGLLSGGERQVVSFAMTLFKDPPLLLLDEPFAGVDAANAEAMLALLSHRTSRRSTAALVVEHRHSVLAHLVDGVLALDDGVARPGRLLGPDDDSGSVPSMR